MKTILIFKKYNLKLNNLYQNLFTSTIKSIDQNMILIQNKKNFYPPTNICYVVILIILLK